MRLQRLLVVTAFVVLGVLPAAGVSADAGAQTLEYHVGDALLAAINPAFSPAIALAPSGDTIEIMGNGTLSLHPKSVTGEGTFVHKGPTGDIVGSGTWTASKLLSFNNYGPSTDPTFPASFRGGQAEILVHLVGTPAGGGPTVEADAVLRVTCRLPGDSGPAHQGADEGITLNVKDATNFNKRAGGATLLIQTSP